MINQNKGKVNGGLLIKYTLAIYRTFKKNGLHELSKTSRQCGVNYFVECQLCPDGSKSIYHLESASNLYTRGIDHENNYR